MFNPRFQPDRLNRGAVRVPVPRHLGALGYVIRRNRTAAGFTITRARSGHGKGDIALALAVRGTLDELATGRLDLIRKPCACCGSKQGGKIALKPGAADLRRLRLQFYRQRPKPRLP